MWIDVICTIGVIIAVLFGLGLLAAVALTVAMLVETKNEQKK